MMFSTPDRPQSTLLVHSPLSPLNTHKRSIFNRLVLHCIKMWSGSVLCHSVTTIAWTALQLEKSVNVCLERNASGFCVLCFIQRIDWYWIGCRLEVMLWWWWWWWIPAFLAVGGSRSRKLHPSDNGLTKEERRSTTMLIQKMLMVVVYSRSFSKASWSVK